MVLGPAVVEKFAKVRGSYVSRTLGCHQFFWYGQACQVAAQSLTHKIAFRESCIGCWIVTATNVLPIYAPNCVCFLPPQDDRVATNFLLQYVFCGNDSPMTGDQITLRNDGAGASGYRENRD